MSEIFSQEDQKDRRASKVEHWGFALPPASLMPSCAPQARRTIKPSDLLIF